MRCKKDLCNELNEQDQEGWNEMMANDLMTWNDPEMTLTERVLGWMALSGGGTARCGGRRPLL